MLPPLMSNHGSFIVSLGNVCRWLAGKAEAGKKAIAGGLVARQRAQHLRRVVSLAFLVETEGLLVTGGGVLGAGALEVLPIAPAADRGDDQHGQADDEAIVALPDLRQPRKQGRKRCSDLFF